MHYCIHHIATHILSYWHGQQNIRCGSVATIVGQVRCGQVSHPTLLARLPEPGIQDAVCNMTVQSAVKDRGVTRELEEQIKHTHVSHDHHALVISTVELFLDSSVLLGMISATCRWSAGAVSIVIKLSCSQLSRRPYIDGLQTATSCNRLYILVA